MVPALRLQRTNRSSLRRLTGVDLGQMTPKMNLMPRSPSLWIRTSRECGETCGAYCPASTKRWAPIRQQSAKQHTKCDGCLQEYEGVRLPHDNFRQRLQSSAFRKRQRGNRHNRTVRGARMLTLNESKGPTQRNFLRQLKLPLCWYAVANVV